MRGKPKPVDLHSLSLILYEVCEILEESPEKVISKSRKRDFILCREIIVFVARETTQNSYLTIGQFLGGRDHTTCINNIEKVKAAFDTNDEIFMKKWNLYSEKSKIWHSYKKAA